MRRPRGCWTACTAGDWDGAYQAVQHIDGRFSALRGYEDEWKKARVTALRDRAKELLEDLRDEVFLCTEEEFQSDRRALLPMVEKLFAMARRLDAGMPSANGPRMPWTSPTWSIWRSGCSSSAAGR
ncbi:MAG: hypothetical protein V8Q30_10405 [Acutalibacteraceae bacterium]